MIKVTGWHNADWHWSLELAGETLYEINPVPIVINSINKKYGSTDSVDELSDILSLLYDNLTEQRYSVDDSGEVSVGLTSNSAIEYSGIYIKISMKEVCHNRVPALLVQVVDTGKSFSNGHNIDISSTKNINITGMHNKKQSLVYELNTLSNKHGSGNRLDAIVSLHMRHGD